MADNTKQAIRAFILESFLFGDEAGLPGDADSLIESGIIDSTGVLELVAFLEERFGLTIADADIVPANLDSVNAIAAFAHAKGVVAAAA